MKGEILCWSLVGLKGLEDKLSWGGGEGVSVERTESVIANRRGDYD